MRKLVLVSDFHDEYLVTSLLGKGNFAKVYKAKRVKTKQIFAIKTFKISELEKENDGIKGLHLEISVMKQLKTN